MGKSDAVCKAYMTDAARFADVFNYFVYGGRQTIDKDDLSPLDPAEVVIIPEARGLTVEQRYRDVLKVWEAMSDGRVVYVLLGVENQTYIDYAMPARIMLYDAMQYMGQVGTIHKTHRAHKFEGLDADELLSGFRKEDRVTPVISLVLYFGASAWAGPTTLHDMLDLRGEGLTQFIPDYRLNLITPASIRDADFAKFATGLGKVLKYIKHSKSKEELARIVSEDAGYKTLDEESARLANVITHSKLQLEAKEGKVDMCEAIEAMRQESYDAGSKDAREEMAPAIAQMRQESYDAGSKDAREETIAALVSSGLVSESQAMDALRAQGIALA